MQLRRKQVADQLAQPRPRRAVARVLDDQIEGIEPLDDFESGRFEILQSDFGMVPMSILGGAITVVDRLEVRFSVLAKAR